MELGETKGREHVRIGGIARVLQLVAGAGPAIGGRVVLLRVQRIADRAFHWFVMRRQRPVLEAGGDEDHRLAVGLHDERVVAAMRVHALRVLAEIRPVGGRAVRDEVGHVVADPAPLVLVPPDELLALRPGAAVGIGRGPVVEDPAVGRPGEGPAGVIGVLAGPVGLARARDVVAVARVDAAIHPAAAGGGAVVLQCLVARDLLAVRDRVAVDLAEDRLGIGFALRAALRIKPGERLDTAVATVRAVGVERLQALAEMVDEPEIGTAVARCVQHGVVPLHQPVGVGDRAVLLAGQGGREEEHLGLDVLRPRLALLDEAALLPEIRRLGHRHVADDQEVELTEALLDQIRVHGADQRVLAEHEPALHQAVRHRERHHLLRHVAGEFGKCPVEELVLGLRVRAVPGLEQAHGVFREVVPPAGRRRLGPHVGRERAVVLERVGLRQVGRQHVVEGRDVGRSLDRRVSAQRQDAAARPAHVAEQHLHDRRGADDLHAGRVVRPADRVADGGRPLRSRIVGERLAEFHERVARRAADALDHLGRVAGIMAFQDLVDGARVFERRVGRRRAVGHRLVVVRARLLGAGASLGDGGRNGLALVLPGRRVVGLARRVEAREQAAVRLRVDVTVLDDVRDVRERHRVGAEPAILLEEVADDAAEEGDIGTGTERRVQVGERARAREARIGVDDRRTPFLRLQHETERDRMVLRHVRAHDQNAVRVRHVPNRQRRRAASEGGPQTGDR